MDFLSLCKKIIEIESTPSTGNEEVARFCAGLCSQAGFQVILQEATLNDKIQYNVIARPSAVKGAPAEEVIFQSHLDTVEPGPLGNWTKTDNNPFKATIEGDRIYGLGTADVKLDFLCKFTALKEFVGKTMKRPFVLVGTYGEEIGMHGAHLLMKSGAVNAKMAIIGEPSELQVVYANNGYMILDFELPFTKEESAYHQESGPAPATTQEKIFHGKAAHSSTPHLGDNAIVKLIKYLEKLPKGIAVLDAAGGSSVNTVPADAHVEVDGSASFENSVGEKLISLAGELSRLEVEFMGFEEKQFSPSHPTLNIGLLKTTPRGLDVSVSFRITPNIDLNQVDLWVNRIKTFTEKIGGQCRKTRLSPPALTPLNGELASGILDVARKLNLPDKPITKASGTECSVYRPHGLECVVFGPGVSVGNSHTANEYNLLSHLESATRFYGEAVKRFCL